MLEVIFHRLDIQLPRYGRKRLFAIFEIVFTAFAVQFFQHWMLFWVDLKYGCLDTGKNFYSPLLKLGLQHLPLYFQKMEDYFASIGGTYAKIWVKPFICRLLNRVYGICSFNFITLWLLCVNWRYICRDSGDNVYQPALKIGLRHSPFYFQNIGGYFTLLEGTFAKIRAKLLLSGFEIGFKAFASLFLEHWRILCVNLRYGCQDEGLKVYFPAMKLGLRLSPFYFQKIGGFLHLFDVRLQKYRRKSVFTCLEMVFTAFEVLFLEYWMLFCIDQRCGFQNTG